MVAVSSLPQNFFRENGRDSWQRHPVDWNPAEHMELLRSALRCAWKDVFYPGMEI